MSNRQWRRIRSRRGVVHPQRRVRLLLVGTLMVFSLFAAQLIKIQGFDAASIAAEARESRQGTTTLPATRGSIVDATGLPMAQTLERRNVIADPWAIDDRDSLEATVATVADVTGADPDRLRQSLTENPESRYLVLVRDISPQTWQELNAAQLWGIYYEQAPRRSYPAGIAPSPIVGWIGGGDQPAGGVEQIFHDELSGEPGEILFERGGNQEIIATGEQEIQPAVPGNDVQLTIDGDLQYYAYEAIRNRVRQQKADSGYAIVSRVDDGQIVAAAQYPSFDPSEAPTGPGDLRASIIEDAYEPGSTGKLIVAAAALELGLVEPEDPIEIPSGGRLPRAGIPFRDATPPREFYRTFAGVMASSSNMGIILAAEDLSDDQLYDYYRKFGIGDTSGLGLPGESPGLIHEPENWGEATKYTMLFGQGVTSNALQQHGVFQTIANGGERVAPSVVAGVTDEDGQFQPAPEPERTQVVSPETAAQLSQIMETVPTAEGTAASAAVEGYRVAGKTSTASRVSAETGRYDGVTAAFIGYAPAEDPQYVVSVVIQGPTVDQWGGAVAGPVFSDIMQYTLQKFEVPPSTEPAPEFELNYDPSDPAPGQPSGVTLDDIAIKDERD